jgi:hypothetical protein
VPLTRRETGVSEQPHRRECGVTAQVVAIVVSAIGLSVLVALSLMQWLEHAA